MDTDKEGSFKPIIIALGLSLLIAATWNSFDFLRNLIHSILNPTAGAIISWNLTIGMLFVVTVLTVATTLIQKYTTDQETLKELKKEQKALQEEAKKYRDDPQKMMEFNKKSMQFMPKMLKLSMRSFTYTAVPLILLFRWFMDYFAQIGDPRFLGFLSWFWFYLIATMIISSIARKILKVV